VKIRLLLLLLVSIVQSTFAQTATNGVWASHGQLIGSSPDGTVRSPSRVFSLHHPNSDFPVLTGPATSKRLESIVSPPGLTEVLWSADSKAFAINSSEGGVVGQWNAYVFILDAHGEPQQHDLRRAIEPALHG
jgi:hypothetical protein